MKSCNAIAKYQVSFVASDSGWKILQQQVCVAPVTCMDQFLILSYSRLSPFMCFAWFMIQNPLLAPPISLDRRLHLL